MPRIVPLFAACALIAQARGAIVEITLVGEIAGAHGELPGVFAGIAAGETLVVRCVFDATMGGDARLLSCEVVVGAGAGENSEEGSVFDARTAMATLPGGLAALLTFGAEEEAEVDARDGFAAIALGWDTALFELIGADGYAYAVFEATEDEPELITPAPGAAGTLVCGVGALALRRRRRGAAARQG